MQVQFKPATTNEVDELTALCKYTFDDDTFKHTGRPGGGAPGYDDPEVHRRHVTDDIYLKILLDGKLIGGIILQRESSEHMKLIRIWIHPEHQDKSIGHHAMDYIHSTYPAKKWTLEVMPYATRNHHFYTKHGYTNTGLLPNCPIEIYVYERNE